MSDDLIFANKQAAKEAEQREVARPLNLEERVQLLEQVTVLREISMSLDNTTRALGKNAPERMVVDSLFAARKYLVSLRGLIAQYGMRVSQLPNADEDYLKLLSSMVSSITATLAEVEKRIRIYAPPEPAEAPAAGAAASETAVEGSMVEVDEEPEEPAGPPRSRSVLVGPDGRPL